LADEDWTTRVWEPSCAQRPLVASLPHGSAALPARFARGLTLREERLWVDAFTPELYAFLPELGAITVEAAVSRLIADPNRDAGGAAYGPFGRAIVASTDTMGASIYREPPSAAELAERIALGHAGYHDALDAALGRLAPWPTVLLLDLHSFGAPVDADVILGDSHGRTASPRSVDVVEAAFTAAGFRVVRNRRYAGGWIVRRFADDPHVDAIQIELNQRTYIDPAWVDANRLPRPHDPTRIGPVAVRLRAAVDAALRSYTAMAGT